MYITCSKRFRPQTRKVPNAKNQQIIAQCSSSQHGKSFFCLIIITQIYTFTQNLPKCQATVTKAIKIQLCRRAGEWTTWCCVCRKHCCFQWLLTTDRERGKLNRLSLLIENSKTVKMNFLSDKGKRNKYFGRKHI